MIRAMVAYRMLMKTNKYSSSCQLNIQEKKSKHFVNLKVGGTVAVVDREPMLKAFISFGVNWSEILVGLITIIAGPHVHFHSTKKENIDAK